jgi:2-iminobutanoate/2-iminopropanoate deaminase
MRSAHNPATVAKPVAGYSQCVCFDAAGWRQIHVAGQVALLADGSLAGTGDVEVQTRQVFDNIRLILNDQGADLADIMSMTVYGVRGEDHPIISTVRNEYLKDAPPASTFVVVAGLARKEWLVEVDVVAIRAL